MGYFFFILFLACLFVPIYCYLIFPLYLKLSVLSFPKVKNNYFEITEWPEVSVIFSVFNEEKVITKKIESILQSDYPKEKIKIFVGSDFSNDHSNDIIEEFVKQNRNINFIKKDSRSGKLNIINELVDLTSSEHLILTDANVFFEPQTLKALVYNLIAKNAQLVCGHILKFSPKNEGISQQEIFYMNFENQLKYNESLKYGFCVGVEGGCYAILKKNFIKVPTGFSPNNDGQNDILVVHGSKGTEILSFEIFDRWGERIFSSSNHPVNDNSYGWDGYYRGEAMPSGNYIWQAKVKYADETTGVEKGAVSLLR